MSSYAHVVHTTTKQVISRRRRNENVCEMSKMKNARAKSVKLLFVYCQIFKFLTFLVPLKIYSCLFFQIAQEKACDYLIIYMKKCEMVKQKKRTRITQSGRNCAIQCVRLIWKQKIWLVLFKPYCLVASQMRELINYFCNELTLFSNVYKKAALLSANQNRVILSCILLGQKQLSVRQQLWVIQFWQMVIALILLII